MVRFALSFVVLACLLLAHGSQSVGQMSATDGPTGPFFTPVDFSYWHNIRIQNAAGAAREYPEGDVILGDVPFSIPEGGNNTWYAHAHPGKNPRFIDIYVGVTGVTKVHTLINTAWGQRGPASYATLEFFGAKKAYHVKELVGDEDIRDYLLNTWTNTINETTTTNVFTAGKGFSNQVRLDKQEIQLPAEFLTEELFAIRLSDTGGQVFQRVLLMGMTAELGKP